MSSDWWAARLSGQPAPRTQPQAYQQPNQPQQQWQPQAQQSQPQARVTMHNLLESVASWRGGEGARNSARCPGCGGDSLFRRKTGATEAAPLCYSCGYNGIFEQVQPRNG